MRRWQRWLMGLGILGCVSLATANEIGFIESFSLAEDRSVPLKQLIPGTEDYYYYHCLYYQQQGELEKVDALLVQWIKRYNYTQQVQIIRNRQALLAYDGSPAKTLEHLRRELNLRFDHQRRELDTQTNFPTNLDPQAIAPEPLIQRALADYRGTVNGFEDTGLELLQWAKLDPNQRRNLLQRLTRPDYPSLPALVVADLRHEHSGGFGSIAIHGKLLLAQLDACLALMPELRNHTNFVNAYIQKLRPSADVDWAYNAAERRAYFERMWTFVAELGPAHNSLKTHVLYNLLALSRSEGDYPRERFMIYLQLPRPVHYANPDWLRAEKNRNYPANLGANFQGVTALPPVGVDETLVRDYLANFLLEADDYEAFSPYVQEAYLKVLFAEIKIVNGVGDMERWYSLMPPDQYQALKARVDLEFLPTNAELIGVPDPVTLAVAVKNVDSLIVKVYYLNTLNYYLANGSAISTAIDLDGLVANEEKTLTYELPPLRRHVERLTFEKLTKPGVYVIELIGNGRSSRALVRKGRLFFHERIGSAGHVLTVYRGDNERVKDARLWLQGREFKADEEGEIALPFTSAPGPQPIILVDGEFASLDSFQHQAEVYELRAGFHAEREALLEGQICTLILRPRLLIHGEAVDIALLEETVLQIQTVDLDGVASSKDVRDLALTNDRESTYAFKVPDRLAQISFTLNGKVKNLSTGKDVELSAARTLALNGIQASEKLESVLLRRHADQYVLQVVGRTGEPRAGRPVYLQIKHRHFKRHVDATLQSDAEGRVGMGRLDGIDWITARGPEGITQQWTLAGDRHTYPESVSGLQGREIAIPYMGPEDMPLPAAVSLLEMRGQTFVKDAREHVALEPGFLILKNLPAGDYSLWLKGVNQIIDVRVTEGAEEGQVLLSHDRFMTTLNAAPLQILDVSGDRRAETIQIRLANATAGARVHVLATRFLPEYDLYAAMLGAAPPVRSGTPPLAVSQYLSGRNIGDEFRYVLERRYATKFPGNMLKRPTLLLNPWSLRKTQTGIQSAAAGDAWQGAPPADRAAREMREEEQSRDGKYRLGGSPSFSTLEFLPSAARVWHNLVPDENGVVSVPTADLGPCQTLSVVAVDGLNTVGRQVALAEQEETYKDLRLARTLDLEKRFTERRNISGLQVGQELAVKDIRTASFEAYDSLAAAYRLYMTLSSDPTLASFSFVTRWADLTKEEKQEKYSEFACHELSLFVYHKDPDFFKAVVLPYLRNKKDKTFVDHWLLGDDLSLYLDAWQYARLNVVERILLGKRMAAERAAMARHVDDAFDRLPPDIERFNHLFQTALKGSALDTDDRFGYLDALAANEPEAQLPGRSEQLKGQANGLQRAAAAVEKAKAPGALMLELDKADDEAAAGTSLRALASKDMVRRKRTAQFYRKLDTTEEWVENNYYHLPIEVQIADLVTVNGFWRDYALHDGKTPFLSPNLAEASHSFAEMMLALAVLDLPFKSGEHETAYDAATMRLKVASPAVIFHKEIEAAADVAERQEILVSENFFALDDRYRFENNERFDKFVTEEFLVQRGYGCQLVLTNPSSTRRKVDVLLQIPAGAIPVQKSFYTRSKHYQLEPYSTQTVEYQFYFPTTGAFPHYPVHVAQQERIIGYTQPFTFNAVDKFTKMDTTSWAYVSQFGAEEEVLAFLREHNIERLDLGLIAFRMRGKPFYTPAVGLLRERHAYHDVLWSYAVLHNDLPAMREYLQHSALASRCGMYLKSPLLDLDPVIRHAYQHKEYWPLVNARTYQLGDKRQILNEEFHGQYSQFMDYLSCKTQLSDDDRIAVAYYLLLQDRIEEAAGFHQKVRRDALASQMQLDYLTAYMAFYQGEPDLARKIARGYADHPVDRWRLRFRQVLTQADEIAGRDAAVVDADDRDEVQGQLAEQAPTFEFKIVEGKLAISYRNLEACTVNYYPMDIELLFSRNPFVQEVAGQFAVVKPNRSVVIKLPARRETTTVDLPADLRDRNVMVEIVAEGRTRSQAYYPNALDIQLMETYGQLSVRSRAEGKPLSTVYAKVYARMRDGTVQFYKDGYTDLRGRFDYSSLSTNALDNVERFSILVMSDEHGAVVQEAAPPKL